METALDTARAYEAAYRDAKAIHGTREGPIEQDGVHKIDTWKKIDENRQCFRCGYTGHLANNCHFRNSKCHMWQNWTH